MNLAPLTVARYGVVIAAAIAAVSAFLGQQAGASLDFVLLRGVFIFIIFTALAFAAEAVLTFRFELAIPAPPPPHHPEPAASDD